MIALCCSMMMMSMMIDCADFHHVVESYCDVFVSVP